MFFLYDANLRILKTIPSNVYQGSDAADDIFFLIPANPNAAVDVSFLLPTGKTLVSRAATKQGEALGLATADGVKFAMWSITLTAQETAFAGNVTLQITLSTGITRKTSQKAVFPVLSGVPAILPDAPTKDVYADIQAAIAALQVVVYDTNSDGIATYDFNNVDMTASVKAFEETATRVVVPAYTIKDDIYYAVTSINAQLPASVTEFVFGKNVTAIGENAFRDTVIETLEFPRNLTYIGDNAFYNAKTTAFYFSGACPTLEKGAFAGVTATAYVPDEYFDDYSDKLSAWSGITVKKRSDTFKDLETAIAEEETARKAADEALDTKKLDVSENFQVVAELSGNSGTLTAEQLEKLKNPYGHNWAIKHINTILRFAAQDQYFVYYKSLNEYNSTLRTVITKQISINPTTGGWDLLKITENIVEANVEDAAGDTDLQKIKIGSTTYKVPQIVQSTGTATDKAMSQNAVTDELKEKLDVDRTSRQCVYAVNPVREQEMVKYSELPLAFSIAYRDNNGELAVAKSTSDGNAVNLGQLTEQLLNYLLKSGGIISGDLSITGDLEVRGTTKTTEEETLNVKDSIIVTNSDGADLSSTLAGFVIRLNATDCYGIIYDASTESVKLGKGKITNGKFTFNSGEGNAVAVRADGSLMTDGHLVKWDATALKFVDASKSVSDIVADAKNAVEEDNFQIVTTLSGSGGTLTDEEFEKLSNPYGHNYIIKYGNEMCKFAAVNSTSIYYKSPQSYTTTSITSIQITINSSTKAWTAVTRMQNGVYANPSGATNTLSSIQIGSNKFKLASDLPTNPAFDTVKVGAPSGFAEFSADDSAVGTTGRFARIRPLAGETVDYAVWGLSYKFFMNTPLPSGTGSDYYDRTYQGAVPMQGRYIHGSGADEYGLYLIKDNDYSTGSFNFITSYGNGASGTQKYILPYNPNNPGEQYLLGMHSIKAGTGISIEYGGGSGPGGDGEITILGSGSVAGVTTIDGYDGAISIGTGLEMVYEDNPTLCVKNVGALPDVPNDSYAPDCMYFLQGNGYSSVTPMWTRYSNAYVGTIKRGDNERWYEYLEGRQRIVDISIMSSDGSSGSYYVSTPGYGDGELDGGDIIEVIFPKKSGTLATTDDVQSLVYIDNSLIGG